MSVEKRGKYGIKQYDPQLYTWTPLTDLTQPQPNHKPPVRQFCNATAGSQGEDFITTYDYNITINTGIVRRLAYVACDYVV